MNWSTLSSELKERIIKQDPEGFNAGGLRPLESSQQKPEARRALEQKPSLSKTSCQRVATSGPVLRVTLISIRSGILDSDSLAFGHWPLRDAIARSFELDDEDGTIDWRYNQIKGAPEGTIVMVQML